MFTLSDLQVCLEVKIDMSMFKRCLFSLIRSNHVEHTTVHDKFRLWRGRGLPLINHRFLFSDFPGHVQKSVEPW